MERIDSPHSKEVDEVFSELNAKMEGLSGAEARVRLHRFGLNELSEGSGTSLLFLILKQFKNWLVIILIVAAIISVLAGQIIDAWVIIIVVLVNSAIGFSQEYHADKAIEALRKVMVKTAKALRDQKLLAIPASELVPGDVVILEEGDRIPADGRIFMASNFRTKEASLMGESLPNSKQIIAIDRKTALADHTNMVWKSTYVVSGYARAVVTATGERTQVGEISRTLGQIVDQRSSFIKKTDLLARQMSVVAISSAVLIFLVGYFVRAFEINDILLTSIAALVAAVPEGLPAVITVVLAIGAKRMAKRNAIVREFTATETLGAVTAILTDKTGTLTRNTLTVRKVYVAGSDEFDVTGEGWLPVGNFKQGETIIDVTQRSALNKLFRIAAISNNAEINFRKESKTHELVGDPTEGALGVLARKGGLLPKEFQGFKVADLPFNSDAKFRATLWKEQDAAELMVVGAPEKLMERSKYILTSGRQLEMSDEERGHLQRKIIAWSDQALRVIALAYKPCQKHEINHQDADELIFVGIVGMIDPPRSATKVAVQKCRAAGIRVIMVTGDHVNTAVAIAKASGIIEETSRDQVQALSQQQLERLGDDEFDQAINRVSVFARLTPKMKLRIADRLQALGHLIAMTGDGVNDAPALKKADVGVAMGVIGTDVARESADVVLADDNFSTIVSAVEEGRIVFTNARQASFFLVTTNIAESATLLLAIFLGLPLPLTATQILWLNLVTDGFTGLALATEPGHGKIMEAPGKKNEQILTKQILPFLIINVALMVILSLSVFLHFRTESIALAHAGVFTVMAFCQLFNVFNLRSIRQSAFAIGFFTNRYINLAVGISVLLLVLVVQVPFLANIFHFQPIGASDFFIIVLLASSVLWSGELYKYLVNVSSANMGK